MTCSTTMTNINNNNNNNNSNMSSHVHSVNSSGNRLSSRQKPGVMPMLQQPSMRLKLKMRSFSLRRRVLCTIMVLLTIAFVLGNMAADRFLRTHPVNMDGIHPFSIPLTDANDIYLRFNQCHDEGNTTTSNSNSNNINNCGGSSSSRSNSNDIRAVVMVTGTNVDEVLCAHIASAYLSGLPVVVVGYQDPYYDHMKKLQYYMRAARQAGLRGEDVVLMTDSDAFYTGVDVRKLIADYIAKSPASLRDLDPLAVREGRAEPPLLVSAEFPCYARWSIVGRWDRCVQNYAHLYLDAKLYASVHNMTVLPNRRKDINPIRHLNSGIILARVWALEHLFTASRKYMQETSSEVGNGEWLSDQSLYAALYFDLLTWEMTSNALFANYHKVYDMEHDANPYTRSTYGLPAGIMDLDSLGLFSSPPWNAQEFTTEAWRGCDAAAHAFPMEGYIEDNPKKQNTVSFNRNLTGLYKMCGATNTAEVLLPLSRHPRIKKLRYTPPLYSVVPRPGIDGMSSTTSISSDARVYPAMVHFAGWKGKMWCFQRALYFSQWALPMTQDAAAKEDAISVLESMYVELWGVERTRVRYADVCSASRLFP